MKKLVFITFLCIAQIAISQNYKFGKVSEEELLEKTNPDYPEANATVLYKKQQISFEYIQGKGFIQKNEIQERIKIYNKEGFDYATRLVRLYDGSSSYGESLNGLKAVTYNLDGGKIIEDKLKKDGIFEEETNKNWKI